MWMRAAARIGSVNTIHNEDGVLTGYSTDGEGFLQRPRPIWVGRPSRLNVYLLGAGGSARKRWLTRLAERECHIVIVANRTAGARRNIGGAREPITFPVCSSVGSLGRGVGQGVRSI